MSRTRVIELTADYRQPNGVTWLKGARAQMHSGVAQSLVNKGLAKNTDEPADPSRGKKRATKRRPDRQNRSTENAAGGSPANDSGTKDDA